MARQRPYRWNEKAVRYRDPDTGRYVSRAQVRAVLDRIILRSQQRVRTTSVALRGREINLAEWDAVMRQEIKRTHLAAAALAGGGWNQLTAKDFGAAGARVREQYQFLDRFVRGLRRGTIRSDGELFNRAVMYPASARAGFHEAQGARVEAAGYTEERNVRHSRESCPSCRDQSALGWVKIGTLIPIGQRTCLGNDLCEIRYR